MVDTAPSLLPRSPIRAFHVTIKAVGSWCNLDCIYCYYLPKEDLLGDISGDRMSDEILEELIRQCITQQNVDTILFTWHGGEPLLLGLDFYRKAIDLQQRYANGKRIENDVQTNGLLVDDAWCEFFREHNFHVGLSIDGPKHLNDAFRRSKSGDSSFDGVVRAARLLKQHDVTINTLSVINSVTARHPKEVYRFLTDELGAGSLVWMPCVELKNYRTTAPGMMAADAMPVLGSDAARPGRPESIVTDWSVDPDDWGEFLCRTFDLWFKHDYGKVLVNWFHSAIGQWIGQPSRVCSTADVCGRALAVEKDGSVYACDHYVYPEYKLGNICDKDHRLTPR